MRISWGENRKFSQGVYQGVLYPGNGPGVAWSGLISVTEKGDDSPSSLYIDGQRHRNRNLPSSAAGIISAFMYPDEFEPYIGLQATWVTAQSKDTFGFSYRNNRELHIVYNAVVAPSSDQYQTLGGDVSPITFSWNFTTKPVDIPAGRPAARVVIMLDYAQPEALAELEAILYGDDENDPSIPDVETIVEIFESHTTIRITDNGDGTWTATGPDELITITGSTFTIDGAAVVFLDDSTYKISSL